MQCQYKTPIVLFTDLAYMPGLITFLMSLERNSGLSSDQEIVVVMTERFNDQEKELIGAFDYKITFVDERDIGDANDIKIPFFELTSINPFPFTYWWFRKTFSKFFLFKMTDYKKIIFSDIDMLCMDNITEMLEFEPFSAAPEYGKAAPKPIEELGGNLSFCTGFMVLEPREDDYQGLIETLATKGPELLNKFPTGDQAIINHYFYTHHPDRVKLLDQRWGITNRMTTSAPELIQGRPKLLHYLGIKPWWSSAKKPAYKDKLEKLWWHYFVMVGKKIEGPSFEDKLAKLDDSVGGNLQRDDNRTIQSGPE